MFPRPENYNQRADDMWMAIVRNVDFKFKNVIDIGCGGGDFLWRCLMAGALHVVGVDKDISLAVSRYGGKNFRAGSSAITLEELDFESDDFPIIHQDFPITICCSVLPYMKNPSKVMTRFCASDQLILEVQYDGDGPGFGFLKDDDDAYKWLGEWWKGRMIIGKTPVPERNRTRTIWLCMK